MPSNQTILHPTDFSEYSACAFQIACTLAREHDAQLVVLHVVPPPMIMYGPPPENYLDHLLEELHAIKPSDSKTRVQYRLVAGDPARMILQVANEINCDWIVIGMHGRTGLDRLLMGSVAEQVVRKAPCPVLTVKKTPQHPVSSMTAPHEV